MGLMTPGSIDSPKTLTAACANGAAGVLMFGVLPMLLGGFAEQFQLDDIQTGTLGSAYFGVYALIALSSVLWIQRFNWRKLTLLGLAIMVGGLLLCRLLGDYQGAIIGLSLVGFGAALVYPTTFTIIAGRKQKDRDYAIKLIPEQLVPGILLVVISTFFADQLSIFKFLFLLIGLLLVAMGLSCWIPDNNLQTEAKLADKNTASNKPVLLGLVALNLYFMGFAGLWAFLERIGSEGAIDQAVVGQLLALGLLSSAIGPFIAAFIGDRFGRTLPLWIATAGSLLPLLLGTGDMTAFKFGAIMAVLPLAYYFGIAYFFGIIADADSDGRFSALMPFALAVGAALGPYFFGVIKSMAGIEGAFGFVAVFVVSGTLLVIFVNNRLIVTRGDTVLDPVRV